MRIVDRMKRSSIYKVFAPVNEYGKGRLCSASHMVLESLINSLATAGIFYSGFLAGHGIDIVDIGIISLMPNLVSLLVMFSPLVLNHFPKRRWFLAACKIMYYVINILGVTLLPEIVHNSAGRIVGLALIIFTANLFNVPTLSGYTTWQANFLPDEVRNTYSMTYNFVSTIVTYSVMLISSATLDSLESSVQLSVIVTIRYFAVALAVLDVVILSLPKEYPYQKTADNYKLADIFLIPIKNKKFLLTAIVILLMNMANSSYASLFDVYIINDAKVPYTFITGVNLSFMLFFLFCPKHCSRLIARKGWVNVLAWVAAVHAILLSGYAFVTHDNYTWLMLFVRVVQHYLGIASTLCTFSLQYVNTPEKDRTYYISFYQFISTLGLLLGLGLGTVYVSQVKHLTLDIFGFQLSGTPTVTWLSSAIYLSTMLYLLFFKKRLMPSKT